MKLLWKLLAKNPSPLLKLFFVDLALCESLLEDVERGLRSRVRTVRGAMSCASEPTTNKTTTTTAMAMKTIIIIGPKNQPCHPPSHIWGP